MVPAGGGSMLFTGATASLRGKPPFVSYAVGKAGLRMLAQSMAREFGPQGLHVGHIMVDGLIDGERIRANAPGALKNLGEDGLTSTGGIAEAFWQMHVQPRGAWSHETEVRPYKEKW